MVTKARAQPLAWRSRWVVGLGAMARRILDIGLPPLCPTCREPVADPGALCSQCWSKLTFISRPYCERLGIPFAYDPGPGMLSMEAIADPPSYNRARAAVRYDETARTMVQAFKYSDRLDLAPAMGHWMATAGRELLSEADSLVAVPLHWRRLWSRRFNQAATLAQTVSRISGVSVAHDLLRRVRATRQQVGLTQAERARNVQGAFRVPREASPRVQGKRLVLVDTLAHEFCFGRVPPTWMCWSLPGLSSRTVRPYSTAKLTKLGDWAQMPVEIYTTPFCPYCLAAKDLLTRKGVSFTEINVMGDAARRTEMVERAHGGRTVPQIFIGQTYVGGCDELYELEESGKLDPLLAGTPT